MTRRRFAFWLGFGLFGLAEKLRAESLDSLAAAITRRTDQQADQPNTFIEPSAPEHWTAVENGNWTWYERECMIDGQWTLAGISRPVHKLTGVPYEGGAEYLEANLVPPNVRLDDGENSMFDPANAAQLGQPEQSRRERHGRPPSKWLRSLYADEIRIWLKTIKVPNAGVCGMTYWTHLTRDHSFDPVRIAGLTVDEQAQLHAAAHYGY
jgi:hypothetical protein